MHFIKTAKKTKLIKLATKITNILNAIHIDIRRKVFKQIIEQLGGKMRFIISGGAPLDPNVQKGFNELGIRLIQGYGLTESSPVICAENDFKTRNGSIGVPMENVTVEIVNKDQNGIGELRAKGPNIMLGYYENEEGFKRWMVLYRRLRLYRQRWIYIYYRKRKKHDCFKKW